MLDREMLPKNEIIPNICRYLEQTGYNITRVIENSPLGIDIIASHKADGRKLFVEALGTSTPYEGRKRHKKPLTSAKKVMNLAYKLEKLNIIHGIRIRPDDRFAVVFRNTPPFQTIIMRVKAMYDTGMIRILVALDNGKVHRF